MEHAAAPAAVGGWLRNLPAWMEGGPSIASPDADLAFLGPGEGEAIQLPQRVRADLLLIDERRGRLEARRRGLRTTGTLGVLLSAGELGLIDAKTMYRRLVTETTFRTSAALETHILGHGRIRSWVAAQAQQIHSEFRGKAHHAGQ